MKTYQKLIFLILFLGLAACSRPENKNSKISLVLPSQMALGSKLQTSIQPQRAPISLAEINCVAVVVSGPETTMSNNSCQYNSGSGTIKFGEFHKTVALGATQSTTLEIEVASGSARVFRLFGFKSNTTACPQLRDPDFMTILSSPYDLGQSVPYELTGASVNVALPISFNAAKEIGECQGPLMPVNSGPGNGGGGGGSTVPYLRIEGLNAYESNSIPSPRALTRGMCYPVFLATYGACPSGIACPTYPLGKTHSISLSNGLGVLFFDSESSCEAGSPLATFPKTMAGGSDGTDPGNRINLWMRIPLANFGINGLNLASVITINTASPEVVYQQGTFAVGSPKVVASQVPVSLAPATCHSQDSTWTFYEAGTLTHPVSSHENFQLEFANFQFFEPGDCTTPASNAVLGGASTLTGRLQKRDVGSNRDFDGQLRTVIRDGDKFLVGGDFSMFGGVDMAGVVRLNQDGSYDPTFRSSGPGISGIRGIVPDGSGKFYVFGDFINYQGISGKNNLVRIFSDGAVDNTFDVSPEGPVYTVLLSGNDLYVGGEFSDLFDGGSSTAQENLARIDLTTSDLVPWNPSVDGGVYSMVFWGSYLYIGGAFSQVGGESRDNLASINLTDATATSWNPSSNGEIRTLAMGSGEIFVAGDFTLVGGQLRSYIAAIDASTGDATAFDAEADGVVSSIVFMGGSIWVGGGFSNIGGQAHVLVARLNSTTGATDSIDPGFFGYEIGAMTLSGNSLYVVGDFTLVGGNSVTGFSAIEASSGNLIPTEFLSGQGSVFGMGNLFDMTHVTIPD